MMTKSVNPNSDKLIARMHQNSKTHTNRIKLLRKWFPIFAGLLIMVVLLWTTLDRFFEKKIEGLPEVVGKIEVRNEVLKPQMVSTDESGNPFKILAEKAVQTGDAQVEFQEPCCEMIGKKGRKLTLKSAQGVLDQEKSTFTYEKDVNLEASDGYKLQIDGAIVDMKSQVITSNNELNGSGPAGSISAKDGVVFDKKKNKIHFKGRTKLVLNPSNKRK